VPFNRSAVIAGDGRAHHAYADSKSETARWNLRSPNGPLLFLATRRASVFEDAFWNALKEIADRRHLTLSELVAAIASERQRGTLSAAIRLFVFEFYRDRICEYENRETMRQILGNATVAITPEREH
jgi:predicted DNA-binding ribbon-helix-helix protein